jgi:hypothetical protein
VLYKAYPSVKLEKKSLVDEEEEEAAKGNMKRGFGK